MRRFLPLALCVSLAPSAVAVEGKWLPEQLQELDPALLKKLGLELPAAALWNDKAGGGLLQAAIDINGCSGAFVSSQGLIITNHHCVFGLIAEHSTPTKNLLEDGFVANSKSDELPGTTARIRVPTAFRDVTDDVHKAIEGAADDVDVYRRTDLKKKALVAACEQEPGTRCDISTYYGGLRHVLIVKRELVDVRLVYAPPKSVGEYGGDVDNWMWPRHTGDFSIVRAYVSPTGAVQTGVLTPEQRASNVPYQPRFHFPLSKTGTKPGDFVMVLGYPGMTVREQLAEEMALRRDRFYPWHISFQDSVITTLSAVGDAKGKIAVAPLLKSAQNRRKNAEGQLAGIARGDLIEKKRAHDGALIKDLKSDAATAHRLLLDELSARGEGLERELLLGNVFSGSRALSMAVRLVRVQSEREKPDVARDERYMERERPTHLKELARDHKAYFAPADQALFAHWVKRALQLPSTHRIAAVDAAFKTAFKKTTSGYAVNDAVVAATIKGMYAKSKIADEAMRNKTVEQPLKALKASADPLIKLALGINDALDAQKRDDDRREGHSLRVRPAWMEAVIAAHKKKTGQPLPPDANRSLRVSLANIQGYTPQDGMQAQPYTSLSGLFAKDTGKEPFNVPDRLKLAAQKGVPATLTPPFLNDVPVCFLADADTTGGNSGSPVVNGRGELVGVNFDRVWENVANDFGYNPAIARNVSVDVRFITWMVRDVDKAQALAAELGL